MKTFYTLICFLLILSCGSTGETINQDRIEKKGSISNIQDRLYEPIIASQIGGFVTPQIWVIKERKALEEIYAQINKTRKPGFTIPKVDFNKESIIAIFMGEKMTGGYAVTVKEVTEYANKISVKVTETSPKASDMVTTVITQPFCVVKVNNATKNMVFKKGKF